MGVTPRARKLKRRFLEFVAAGVEWAKAAKKAGYSDTTILKKSATLKRRAGEATRPRSPNGFPKAVLIVPRARMEWSPVSGRTWVSSEPSHPEPKPKESRPPNTPVEHSILGDGVVSANGGFLPAWARNNHGAYEINLSSLPSPNAYTDPSRSRAWARMRAEQDRLARSYSTHREVPEPPPLPPLTPTAEELPGRGYKDAGRDVLQEALEGRFGFAELPVQGE